MATPQNMVFILSDEHNRKIAGAYGHPFIETPNIDALAAAGTTFDSAYTNCPICVPARAALATGLPVHETGCWDNAHPFRGEPESWHEKLRSSGADVVSVGKLHFRGGDDYGFTEELLPLHVVGGKGDLKGLLRQELPKNPGTPAMAAKAGRGVSTYFDYDGRIADRAVEWLEIRAARPDGPPFVLLVNLVMPHFPLIAPPDYFDRYAGYDLATLRTGIDAPPPDDHPTMARMRAHFNYDDYFDDEVRAMALRAYFGMVTRVDEIIGDLMTTLDATGLTDNTRILYTSDHGDNLGSRGLWGKSVMYEDSVAIPMVMAGADVPAGKRCATPVSLTDIAPTMLDALGRPPDPALPGRSLIEIANAPDEDRPVLSEYHAAGSDTGQFMLRFGRWKLVYFVGAPPQLFDLVADPDERCDLGRSRDHADVVAEMTLRLRGICDPEEINARAFADQKRTMEANGGRDGIMASVDIPFTPAPS
ncbi:MAG: sulfatase-like hydrolase/transferase [Rhodobiaceae bacterium]|nr:sulfatase-like hydrolase/transferase [Rhodobiaceae bacterium]